MTGTPPPESLVQLVVDCATGAATYTPLTPQQVADLDALRAETAAGAEAAEAARADRAESITAVLNAPSIAGDPALQDALAMLLGVPPPPRATQLPVLPEEP